jgi:type IV secretion system protein VirB3
LFLGGEREPTLMMAIVAAGLAVSGQNVVTLVVAAALWFGSIGLFRQVAKIDPQMSLVYTRELRYQGYYPPRSRPYRDAGGSPRAFYAGLAVATVVLLLLYWIA